VSDRFYWAIPAAGWAARGIAIECGCFPAAAGAKTMAELFAGMKLDLLRDAGLWLLAFQVLLSRTAAGRA
jgi:hypothetical protein